MVCFKPEKDGAVKVTAATGSSNPTTPSDPDESAGASSSQVVNMVATQFLVSGAVQHVSSQVLLATAVVIVEDDEGSQFSAHALLDFGSESNFITERLSQRLRT